MKELVKELVIESPAGYEIDQERSTFSKIVFKEKQKLPTAWKDLGEIRGFYIDDCSNIVSYTNNIPLVKNKNTWPTKELAEASSALCQLVRFRNIYNEGWTPNWTDLTDKHVITTESDCIVGHSYANHSELLAFKTADIRDKFLNAFKDLIEIARPFL